MNDKLIMQVFVKIDQKEISVPTFITDSESLAPYLHTRRFRGEGHPAESGVTIKFFEIV